MGRKHKAFNKGDGEGGEVRELKEKIKRLASDKKKLISELQTLKEAFDKTRKFVEKKVEDISVEELIKHSKKPLKKLEEVTACSCGFTQFSYITTPSGSKIKICKDCKKRETIYDSQEFDTNQEI